MRKTRESTVPEEGEPQPYRGANHRALRDADPERRQCATVGFRHNKLLAGGAAVGIGWPGTADIG